MPLPGHFLIAAGVTNDPSIPKVKDDLRIVSEYFTTELGYAHMLPELIGSPTAESLRRLLSNWFAAPERQPDDRVVFYFSGHGELGRDAQHYLLLSDSDPERPSGTGFPTYTLATVPFESAKVRQVLVILDTCFSGAGVADTVAWASRAQPNEGCLLQLISSSRRKEFAGDGAFAPHFIQAIRNVTASLGRQVQEYLAVDSVMAQLEGKLPAYQQATWQFAPNHSSGTLSPIRNPHFDRRVPAGLDLEDQEYYKRDLATHFVPRAEGGEILSPDSNIWYFSGRHRALQEICNWLKTAPPTPRLLVVTGRPGVGKSALLGRLVTLADPRYRTKILAATPLPDEMLPPARAFKTAVHLRSREVREVAGILTAALGLESLDPRLSDEDTGTSLVQGIAGLNRPCCLMFDALDEAARPKEMWRHLLRPLCGVPQVRVVIGARPVFQWGAAAVIDLSEPGYLGDTDIQDYVTRRLLAAEEPGRWTPYRDRAALAGRVAQAVAVRAGGVFLVARIVSRLLIESPHPIDTRVAGWKELLPGNVRDAFEEYLERFGALETKVRDILLPLAFAEGQGLPWESIWAALAGAISGRSYGDSEIREVLEKAGPFIIETQDRGRSVYRLYHQALTEYLRETERGRETTIRERFVEVLRGSIPRHREGGADYARAHPYVSQHLVAHAAQAGRLEELLPDAGLLVSMEPAGVIPWLWRVQADAARPWRNVYQLASHLLGEVSWMERASILERVAREQGLKEIGDEFGSLGGNRQWRVVWSVWQRATPHRTLRGHEGRVYAVAVSEHGGRPLIVSAGRDATVRVWDLETGAAVGEPLRGHKGSVTAVALSTRGRRRRIVSAGEDGTVRVWDLVTGTRVGKPLRGHEGWVNAVAVSEHGGRPLIVSAGEDGTLRVWDLETRAAVGEPLRGHEGGVQAVAVSERRGRRLIVSGGWDKTVRVWDAETGRAVGEPLRGHEGWVKAVALSEHGGRPLIVSAAGVNNTVRVWDLQTGVALGALRGNEADGVVVALSEHGGRRIIVSSGWDKPVQVWDLETGAAVGEPLRGHEGPVNAVAVSEHGGRPLIVSAGEDATVRVWDLETGAAVGEPLRGHEEPVIAVAVSEHGGRPLIVSAGEDGTVRVWDPETGAAVGEPLRGHEDWVTAVAVSEHGGRPLIVSAGGDATVRVWHLDTGRAMGEPLRGHEGSVNAVAVSEHGGRSLIVSAGGDATVRVWDLKTGAAVGKPLCGHRTGVTAVAVSEHGGRPLIVSAGDITVRVWDLETGAAVGELWGHKGRVTAVAVSEHGGRRLIVSAGDDQTVRIWDLETGTQADELVRGYGYDVNAVAVSEHGGRPLIVTGGDDQTVRVWDLRSGRFLARIDLGSPVHSIAALRSALFVACDSGLARIDLYRL